jgi:hypothetical protein
MTSERKLKISLSADELTDKEAKLTPQISKANQEPMRTRCSRDMFDVRSTELIKRKRKNNTLSMMLSRLFLVPGMLAVVHGSPQLDAAVNFIKPLDKTIGIPPERLLRGLQPDPPSPPPFPDPNEDGELASYCDFLFLFFKAQADAHGYDCECVTDDEKDTVTCKSRKLNCDAYDVGDVQVICHSDHFSSSTTRGTVSSEGYKIFDFQACAKYSDERYAPEPLVGSELCFDYKLSVVWGKGYNLDECGLTWTTAGGETTQVCLCAVCYTAVGAFSYLGLGLDCNESVIPGITLIECQAITDTNPAVIPRIEEYSRQDSDTTDSPPTTVAPASTQIAATIASTEPVTTAAVTKATTTIALTVAATTADPGRVTDPTTGVPGSTTAAPITTDSPTPTSASMQVKAITVMVVLLLSLYSLA